MKVSRSQLLSVLTLEAPTMETPEALEEYFTHRQCCNRCHGSRKINTWNGEYEHHPCPVCKGSGELVAHITIKWWPAHSK